MNEAQTNSELALKALIYTSIEGVSHRDLLRLNIAVNTMKVEELKIWGQNQSWFNKVEPLLEFVTHEGKLHDSILEAILDRVIEGSED